MVPFNIDQAMIKMLRKDIAPIWPFLVRKEKRRDYRFKLKCKDERDNLCSYLHQSSFRYTRYET